MIDCIVTLIEAFLRVQVSYHDFVGVILMVILCTYNARLINGGKGKISWLVSYTSNHSNDKNPIVLPETIKTSSSDPDIMTEMENTEETEGCYERVLSMYNTLVPIKGECNRRGFKVEVLLGSHDKDCWNIADYNLQQTSSFKLLLDPLIAQ